MGDYILILGSKKARPALAGTKGANLSGLVRAGFRIPSGYIITTLAYRTFIMANEIERQLADLSALSQNGDVVSQEEASRQICALFEAAKMPDEVRCEILDKYRELEEAHLSKSGLESMAVAVRSSAIAEDLPDASFAGQLKTILNVRGERVLIESVIRCFASLWTTRAMSYRVSHQFDTKQLENAVIVQEMVAADCAGVLFTVNPMSGNTDEVVINAAWGLGEPVVSGEVTPDYVIVDKGNERVKRVEVGSKEIMAVAGALGIIQVPVVSDMRRKQALSEEQAIELARLGKMVEAQFGRPQDVEWAISDDCIYTLQSRPVTSIPPKTSGEEAGRKSDGLAPVVPGDWNWSPHGECATQPYDLWTRANVGEIWPEPVSPLVWSIIPEFIGGAVRFSLRGLKSTGLMRTQWAGCFYGRVYFNEGALRHVFAEELGLPASFIDRSRGNSRVPVKDRDDRTRLHRVLRHLPVLVRLLLRQRRTGRDLEAFIRQVDRWVQQFNTEKLLQRDDRRLWDEAMIWLERIKTALNLQYEISGLSMTAFATLERLMIRWFNRHDLARDVITGISGIQAAEMGIDLCKIAKKLDDLGLRALMMKLEPKAAWEYLGRSEHAASAMDMFREFIERHGYRCPNEAEWLRPRWADAPEQVVELAAAYLRSGTLDVEESNAKQKSKRESAVAWIESHAGPLRRIIFRRVVGKAQYSARMRDNGKSCAIKASYPARQITVLIGRRWAGRSWLKRPEDVFFLTLTDISRVIEAGDPVVAGIDLNDLVCKRRLAFEYWFDHDAPNVIDANGKAVPEAREIQTAEMKLEGIAASGGWVQGKVRILHDPAEATRLQPGEILVTRSIDAGWSAVFPLTAGLVTEIGGQLSHAAILAREYGLPAVVNVRDATQRLKDQQVITIDGSTGLVYLKTEIGLL